MYIFIFLTKIKTYVPAPTKKLLEGHRMVAGCSEGDCFAVFPNVRFFALFSFLFSFFVFKDINSPQKRPLKWDKKKLPAELEGKQQSTDETKTKHFCIKYSQHR